MTTRVVEIDQPYQNPPPKSTNGQPDQGLIHANFDLKALTTSSFAISPYTYPSGNF